MIYFLALDKSFAAIKITSYLRNEIIWCYHIKYKLFQITFTYDTER